MRPTRWSGFRHRTTDFAGDALQCGDRYAPARCSTSIVPPAHIHVVTRASHDGVCLMCGTMCCRQGDAGVPSSFTSAACGALRPHVPYIKEQKAEGRVTIQIPHFNDPDRVAERRPLIETGMYL